jgi:hypothetical protein
VKNAHSILNMAGASEAVIHETDTASVGSR